MIAGGYISLQQIVADQHAVETNPLVLSLAQFLSTPFVVGYFVFAARASGLRWSDYLALKWPRLKHFLIGLVAVVAALVLSDLLSVLVGHEVTSTFMNDVLFAARDRTTQILLALAVVVLAPLQEEIMFRGFLLPGFARNWGAPIAIVVTSALWAGMHVQYDWFFMTQIFLIGILFGWLRLWSGSTLLVIILHAAVNAGAIAEVYLATSPS